MPTKAKKPLLKKPKKPSSRLVSLLKKRFVLVAVVAVFGVVGVVFLFSSHAATGVDRNANKVLAQQILANPKIKYYVTPNGNSRTMVEFIAANGYGYTTCPDSSVAPPKGTATEVNTNMLRFLVDAGQRGTIMINAITDKCHTSKGSRHYVGTGLDMDTNTGNIYSVSAVVSLATQYGGIRNTSKDELDHIHLDFKSDGTPLPTTNIGTVIGNAESANCRYVTGWAFDPDNKAANVRIDVYVDGPYAPNRPSFPGGTTNKSRPDVNGIHGTSGTPGFNILIPEAYRDGKDHVLYVYGINAAGPGNNWVQAIRFTGCANPIGNTERFDCSVASGWVLDLNEVSAALEYHVYVDGRYYTKGLANLARPDVISAYAAYNIGGYHGYSWTIPSAFKDSKPHKFEIFAINRGNGNSNPFIGPSSKTMTCARSY